MTRFFIKSRLPCDRLVLVLLCDSAHWFKVVDAQISAHYVEPILDDRVERHVSCPWLSGVDAVEPTIVELILGTTMDEVDRVSVEQSASTLINRYRQRTTVGRLRRDYPQAHVYPLPEGYDNQVAALMHPSISEQWSSWLLFIQSCNVMFSKVATASELAADWARSEFDEPVMLIMSAVDHQRHLLVDQGTILFLRTVRASHVGEQDASLSVIVAQEAVSQSIQHLSSVIPVKNTRIQVVSGFSVAAHPDALPDSGHAKGCVHPCVTEGQNSDFSRVTDVYCLVGMLLGLPVDYDSMPLDGDGMPVRQAADKRHDRGKSGLLKRWLVRTTSFMSADFIQWLLVGRRRWMLSRAGIAQINALAPSVSNEKMCRQISIMFRLSVTVAAIATISVTAALANGINSARTVRNHEQQRIDIERVVVDTYHAASAIHSLPELAADSLILKDSLASAKPFAPVRLLSEFAGVITAVPGVSIDRLVWAVTDSAQVYESFAHALAAVPHRRSLDSQAGQWVVQVELTGKVPGKTLPMRKKLLDTLIAEIQKLRGATGVRVHESPVDTALSSTTDSTRRDLFRLTLQLGSS